MQARAGAVAVILLSTSLVAGCFGSEVALGGTRTVTASGPALLARGGWAYDGANLTSVPATLHATFTDEDNTGTSEFTFEMDGKSVGVTFDRFQEASGSPFQDGGIAFDLVEHGDSGMASPAIPKILALVAAWGEASVTFDGELFPDPHTGGPTWSAHLMVSDTTVRGEDGKITKADGSTPYAPATPGDARRLEGNRQMLFHLKPHPRTAEPVMENHTVNVAGPGDRQTFTLPVGAGDMGFIQVSVEGNQGASVAVGNLTLMVTDPEGNEVATGDTAVTPGGPAEPLELQWPGETPGDYTVTATAQGAFTYHLAMQVVYRDVPDITLTWDEFAIE